jgi:hypothetical protein
VNLVDSYGNILTKDFAVDLGHYFVNVFFAGLDFSLVLLSIVFVPDLNHSFENANFPLVV